jgi:hypothetical protein
MVKHPIGTFEAVRKESLGRALRYFLILLLLASFLLVIGGIIIRPIFLAPYLGDYQYMGWLGILLIVPFVLVQGFIGLGLTGVVLHPFIRLFGGNGGLAQTFKALVYGSTPLILSLWFPPLIGLTVIWAFILMIIGLRKTQEISTMAAAVSILLPMAVLTALSLIISSVFYRL